MITSVYIATTAERAAEYEALEGPVGTCISAVGETSYSGKPNQIIKIDATAANYADVAKRFLDKAKGYGIDRLNHNEREADTINAMTMMQNPGSNSFIIPVKSEDSNWFGDCFKNTLAGMSLYVYDNNNYLKYFLDFTDGELTQSEITDLTSFKGYIDTKGHSDTAAIGKDHGPDMLTLYTFATEAIAAYEAAHPSESEEPVVAAEPNAAAPSLQPGINNLTKYDIMTGKIGDINALPNAYFTAVAEATGLKEAMGNEFSAFLNDSSKSGFFTAGDDAYDDAYFFNPTGDNMSEVEQDELRELAGELVDSTLDAHLAKLGILDSVRKAARHTLAALREGAQFVEFTYVDDADKSYDVNGLVIDYRSESDLNDVLISLEFDYLSITDNSNQNIMGIINYGRIRTDLVSNNTIPTDIDMWDAQNQPLGEERYTEIPYQEIVAALEE